MHGVLTRARSFGFELMPCSPETSGARTCDVDANSQLGIIRFGSMRGGSDQLYSASRLKREIIEFKNNHQLTFWAFFAITILKKHSSQNKLAKSSPDANRSVVL